MVEEPVRSEGGGATWADLLASTPGLTLARGTALRPCPTSLDASEC